MGLGETKPRGSDSFKMFLGCPRPFLNHFLKQNLNILFCFAFYLIVHNLLTPAKTPHPTPWVTCHSDYHLCTGKETLDLRDDCRLVVHELNPDPSVREFLHLPQVKSSSDVIPLRI